MEQALPRRPRDPGRKSDGWLPRSVTTMNRGLTPAPDCGHTALRPKTALAARSHWAGSRLVSATAAASGWVRKKFTRASWVCELS